LTNILVKTARYNMFFPKVANLRRKAFEIEDQLSPYFNAVTLVPVPDEAPEEIPRISTSSHHGHSSLNISLTNAQIATNYDEKFENDWPSCLSYLKERVNQISNVLSKYINGQYLFSGLTIELIVNGHDNPIELIKNNFLNYKGSIEPYDLQYKVTFLIDQIYYVNITFSNVRTYEGIVPLYTGIHNFVGLKEISNALAVSIDINDRHGFNYEQDYFSSTEKFEHIFEIAYKILDSRLIKMIEEGVIEL